MEFHGRWQSGQLLSRVTTDLSRDPPVLGLRPALPGHQHPPAHASSRRAAARCTGRSGWSSRPPRCRSIWLSKRFEQALRRGLPPGPGPAGRPRHAGRGGRRRLPRDQVVRPRRYVARPATKRRPAASTSTSMDKVRLSARFWTFLEVIPNVAVVVVLLLGALGVGKGALTLGTLVAFITLMLSLVWPIAALGVILAMAQEAMTAADRVLEIFDTEPAIVGGDRASSSSRAGTCASRASASPSPTPTSSVLHDVDLDVAPGRDGRHRRRHRLRQDRRSPPSCRGSTTSPPAGSRSTGSTSATSTWPACARSSRPRSRSRRCSR